MNNLDTFKKDIEQAFNFHLNKNQYIDVKRLIYEIKIREKISEENIIAGLKTNSRIDKAEGRNKFFVIKEILIKKRYPLTSAKEKIDAKSIYLPDIRQPVLSKQKITLPFIPEQIFVEKKARDSYLAKRFKDLFPGVPTEELNHHGEYLQNNKFSLGQLKRPIVFIVEEQWDFIRPCPCTKGHLGCNYWIFNIGFGCPYDCSYCFLQQYANFPGIILPANLDDFFLRFNDFYKRINSPIRIGTGEFCDSLALDHITNYSKQLISFFQDKPVFFELKTKSNNIENLLQIKASKNIIISWSLNPQRIIDQEEINTASLKERLEAAKKVRTHGFSLSFHFDPIIYSENWSAEYKTVIDTLYSELSPGFKWISLGTLRGTRKLKNTSEIRFPQSDIFYGELFLGKDKKLRYPEFIRHEIYKKMYAWIREYDKETPVYLCMEDPNAWQNIDNQFNSSSEIERYLLR